MKKFLKKILIIIISLLLILFLIRVLTSKEIDDVHPLRGCEEEYIEKADTLWIMPKYLGYEISENKTWCEKILSLNKTLGMHGITHSEDEFNGEISNEEFSEAIQFFESCFNKKPEMFKAPYLKISKENKELVKKNNLKLRNPFHQTIHKVYHCQNSGTLSNRFYDIF